MTKLATYLEQPNEVLQAVKLTIYGVFTFLDIDVDVVNILAILMGIDTVLGIIRTVILRDKFSFKTMLWGLLTKAAVLIIPMVLALTAKALDFDFRWFVVAVINVIIVAEAFSCMTNILSIKTKRRIENVDYITLLLHSIRAGLSSIIKRLLGNIKEPNQ